MSPPQPDTSMLVFQKLCSRAEVGIHFLNIRTICESHKWHVLYGLPVIQSGLRTSLKSSQSHMCSQLLILNVSLKSVGSGSLLTVGVWLITHHTSAATCLTVVMFPRFIESAIPAPTLLVYRLGVSLTWDKCFGVWNYSLSLWAPLLSPSKA